MTPNLKNVCKKSTFNDFFKIFYAHFFVLCDFCFFSRTEIYFSRWRFFRNFHGHFRVFHGYFFIFFHAHFGFFTEVMAKIFTEGSHFFHVEKKTLSNSLLTGRYSPLKLRDFRIMEDIYNFLFLSPEGDHPLVIPSWVPFDSLSILYL